MGEHNDDVIECDDHDLVSIVIRVYCDVDVRCIIP